MTSPPRYHLTLAEYQADGTLKVRIEGNCSAYVIGICEDRTGPLRVLTDHDGPPEQRRRALTALRDHVRKTIGLIR